MERQSNWPVSYIYKSFLSKLNLINLDRRTRSSRERVAIAQAQSLLIRTSSRLHLRTAIDTGREGGGGGGGERSRDDESDFSSHSDVSFFSLVFSSPVR